MLSRGLLTLLLGSCAAVASAEVLYVSSFGSDEVFRFNPATGAFIDTFITAGSGGLNQPHGVLDRGGDVLVSSAITDQVLRYDRQTGAPLGELIGPDSGLDCPVSLVVGPDENLYVASQLTDEVLRYDGQTGELIDAFVTAGSGGLSGPSGIAFGPDGRLYVSGRFGGSVIAYDGQTGAFDEVIADSSDGLATGSTFGLAFGGNGDLYFASNSTLFRYDLQANAIAATAGTGFPIGVEPAPGDPSGGVFVATSNNLRRMDGVTDTLDAAFLGPGASFSTLNFFHFSRFATVDLPGDYNGDGSVDAADYTTWRDAMGSGTPLDNDTTPGGVATEDYAVWAENYSAVSVASNAVPEPSALLIVAATMLSAAVPGCDSRANEGTRRRKRRVPQPV